ERVTSALALTWSEAVPRAGQAVVADVNQRLGGLDVGSRFPLRLNWSAALVPVGATLLAAVAIFYEPPRTQATVARKDDAAQKPANATEIDKKMKELRKQSANPRGLEKSKDIKEQEEKLEAIANRQRETKEQRKDRREG